MPGGRERNILRWELRTALLREELARLDARLARLDASAVSSTTAASGTAGQREDLLAQRAHLARQLDALGPDPRGKMG